MATYRVKAGDTLSIIARDVLGDIARWPELAELNGLTAPYTIYPGQQLQLPDDVGTPVLRDVQASAAPRAVTAVRARAAAPLTLQRLLLIGAAAAAAIALMLFSEQRTRAPRGRKKKKKKKAPGRARAR